MLTKNEHTKNAIKQHFFIAKAQNVNAFLLDCYLWSHMDVKSQRLQISSGFLSERLSAICLQGQTKITRLIMKYNFQVKVKISQPCMKLSISLYLVYIYIDNSTREMGNIKYKQ